MARSRVEWIKLWQARIRDFEPEMETQGARADDRMVIIAERSGRVMLHFCSLTLVRTVQSALAQTTFSEQTGRHDGRERKEGLYMSLIFDILTSIQFGRSGNYYIYVSV